MVSMLEPSFIISGDKDNSLFNARQDLISVL